MDVPKIPKPFVAPGRQKPVLATTELLPPPPEIPPVHAVPVESSAKMHLTLQATPPPIIDTAQAKTAQQSTPGEPLDILSLSDRPVPVKDTIVVSPGNIIGKTGDGLVLRSGAAAPSPAASAPGGPPAVAPANPVPPSPAPGSTASASNPGPSTPPSPAKDRTAAGTVSSAAASAPAPRAPSPGVIVRPPDGAFDAVVIQASPTDQFPESKGLLTGRPIYSVYISAGTARDWTLFFCVPGAKDAVKTNSNVVHLEAATPVLAPYPTRIVRPGVTVPLFFKYVLVHGFVTAAGRFESLRVVRSVKPETDEAILAALSGWEFRAATRDGAPIAVEFLLSIPVAGM
jgi:hypothetical protein